MFNPVAPYGYLLSNMYLFMADITHPDSYVDSAPPSMPATLETV